MTFPYFIWAFESQYDFINVWMRSVYEAIIKSIAIRKDGVCQFFRDWSVLIRHISFQVPPLGWRDQRQRWTDAQSTAHWLLRLANFCLTTVGNESKDVSVSINRDNTEIPRCRGYFPREWTAFVQQLGEICGVFNSCSHSSFRRDPRLLRKLVRVLRVEDQKSFRN